MSELRSVSYGGGVQSTALLVLAAQSRIDFPLFLLANVGEDSEHPDTLRYLRDVAMPYAAEHGIELVELHRVPTKGAHAGKVETLYGRLMREGSRSLPIPVRMSNGAPSTRSCTADFKIRVVGQELKRRGATVDNPATVALGISTDEIERATPGIDPKAPYQTRVYPLLDLGLSRHDCARLITAAGLPVPPKSACWFCPFHDKEAWRKLKRDTPDLFDKACHLEATLIERRAALPCPRGGTPAVRQVVVDYDEERVEDMLGAAFYEEQPVYEEHAELPGSATRCPCGEAVVIEADGTYPAHGKGPVWLTRHNRPLAETIDDQLVLDGMDGCDSGWCMT